MPQAIWVSNEYGNATDLVKLTADLTRRSTNFRRTTGDGPHTRQAGMAAAPRSDARASSPSSVKPDVAGAEPSFEGADIRAAIEQYEKDVLRAASCCAVLGCIRVNVVEPGKALEQQ